MKLKSQFFSLINAFVAAMLILLVMLSFRKERSKLKTFNLTSILRGDGLSPTAIHTKGLAVQEFNASIRRCSMADRLQSVKSYCLKRKNIKAESAMNGSLTFLLVDDFHKVIYCSIPKAASTTWKTIFVRSINRQSADQMAEHAVEDEDFLSSVGLRYMSSYSHKEAMKRIKTYFKFLVVRHPFERLVSAYRDKIARFNPYGAKIRERLARRYIDAAEAEIRFDSARRITVSEHSHRFMKISFRDFIRYVVSAAPGTSDHHWATYNSLCSPCEIDYDAIVKMETMTEDAIEVILPKLDLSNNFTDLPILNNRRSTTKVSRRSPETSGSAGFLKDLSNVSPGDVEKLVEIYKDDMEMFGYKWNERKSLAYCRTKEESPIERELCC